MNLGLIAATLLAAALGAGCATAPPQQGVVEAALRTHRVVLLGEVHDNAAQHALRARALGAWLDAPGTTARPALLMEQFDRDRQSALDTALAAPGATPDSVIAAAASPNAGWDWTLYKPYLALAMRHRLPVVAVNVSRAEARQVMARGLPVPADVADVQAREIADAHCGQIDVAVATRMVPAQVARDQEMARAIEAHAARGAVLLAGNGHVRRDVGVPRWLAPDTRAATVAVGLLEGTPDATQRARYDEVVTTPAQPRKDPCGG